MRLFALIDDALIDHAFQPIADWIRLNIGWSKRIPAGISFFATSITLLTALIWEYQKPLSLLGICLSLFWSISRTYELFMEEINGVEDNPHAFSGERVGHRPSRYMTLILLGVFCITMPLVYMLISYQPPLTPVLLCFYSFVGFAFCACYFEACTDLPKPPKKSVWVHGV